LAGNLRDFTFESMAGEMVTGADVDYNGSPGGYTLSPIEHIVYVAAHDNETLFDAIQYKAPLDTPMADRVRMHNMGMSLTLSPRASPSSMRATKCCARSRWIGQLQLQRLVQQD
jgi:pullulanase